MESLLQDVRYALRGIRNAKLFAGAVAATIGLGLGVLASAFAFANAYVLKPIDLPNPHQLYSLSWDTAGERGRGFTLDEVETMRTATPAFSDLIASKAVTAMQDGIALPGQLVTANYFNLLGAAAVRGRTLIPEDAERPGERAVVVLSDAGWRSRFGGDPEIVGKDIDLGRFRYKVVGVMPASFALRGAEGIVFWAPLTMARNFPIENSWTPFSASGQWLFVMGRLRPDATEAGARAWLDAWVRQRYPAGTADAPVAVRLESQATRLPVTPATTALFSLIVGAFGLVLLVACANVANMMLARGLSRQREIAVRLSLGAGRARIVTQLVIESLVLAGPAAAFGYALTLLSARAFPALVLGTIPSNIPAPEALLAPLDPDARVLACLFIAAVVAAILFGLSPALQMARTNLAHASKGEFGNDIRVSTLRSTLVVAQIAACALFLACATGLILQAMRMANPQTGLSFEQVSDVRVAPELRVAVIDRLRLDPAVDRVAVAWRPPLYGPLRTMRVLGSTGAEASVGFTVVSPEYFETFGIRVLRGRGFSEAEARDGAGVAMVDEGTAGRLWPGLDALGQTLDVIPPATPQRRPVQTRVRIVGITADVVNGSVINTVETGCVYFPTTAGAAGGASILVRAKSELASLRSVVMAAVNGVRIDAPFEVYPIREAVGIQLWAFEAFSAAASLLGLVGLLLAFSGTYSVVGYLVTQRTREFGIRMALGATVGRIIAGVMQESLRVSAAGIAIGTVLALGAATFAGSVLPSLPVYNVAPFLIGATVVLLATAAAAYVPSRRAARIDPSRALQSL